MCSTNVFEWTVIVHKLAQVESQFPVELLEQEPETALGDGRVESALAELITDERVLGGQDLQERELHAVVSERLSDQVTALRVDVGVRSTEDQDHFLVVAQLLRNTFQRVVVLAQPQGSRVDVRGEEARCARDPLVQQRPEGQMAPQTHPRGPNSFAVELR